MTPVLKSLRTAAGAMVVALIAAVAGVAAKIDAPPPGGGELRFALRAEPKTLDPLLVMDEASETVRYLTSGVLIRQNRSTQELEPALAQSWTVMEGGKAILFHLRPGVRFSDGTPFTAQHVAYTVSRINDAALHSPLADTLKSAEGNISAEVRSPTAVVVRVPGRIANLPELFDQVPIVSRTPAKAGAPTLGPFAVAEYKAGSYLLLRRNPNYWKKDAGGRALPYLDSVRLDIVNSRDMELMRFRRGEFHLLNGLDAESFDRLAREMPGAARDLGPSLDSEQFWFNQVATAPIPAYKREWFRSTEFRSAISMAIQRADICRLVYRGHALSADGSVSPGNRQWVNAKLKAPVYSVPAALALLSKAGFQRRDGILWDRGGHPVEFSVMTNAGNKSRERMAALIQQDLAKLGIKLNIVPMDFPSLVERITRSFQYEACLLGQNAEVDPNTMLNVWRSSAPNHQWNPNQKKPETQWESEIDRLLDEQGGQTDPVKRKAAFDRVQAIVAEQQPFIYLVHKNALVAVSPRVRDAQPAVLRPQTFWNVDSISLIPATGR